KLGEMWNNTA
nr:p23=amphoterin homolog {Lys-C digestion product, internal fragment} [cattle, lung, Peptide Partial, 10 aa] [Bos taurus]